MLPSASGRLSPVPVLAFSGWLVDRPVAFGFSGCIAIPATLMLLLRPFPKTMTTNGLII